jgi:hypothetical protein
MENAQEVKEEVKEEAKEEAPKVDDYGLPTDGKHYARRNCKNCYGRGNLNYVSLVKNEETGEKEWKTTRTSMCGCALKKYTKINVGITMKIVQAFMAKTDFKSDEDKIQYKAEILPKIRAEFGF